MPYQKGTLPDHAIPGGDNNVLQPPNKHIDKVERKSTASESRTDVALTAVPLWPCVPADIVGARLGVQAIDVVDGGRNRSEMYRLQQKESYCWYRSVQAICPLRPSIAIDRQAFTRRQRHVSGKLSETFYVHFHVTFTIRLDTSTEKFMASTQVQETRQGCANQPFISPEAKCPDPLDKRIATWLPVPAMEGHRTRADQARPAIFLFAARLLVA
ncbi:hypothetical protein M409DRAFT_49604 [Zasmidium cellare ATCC 36951]|uniref:Uncharacterized protein n=1 Tax=Zasmidium cellare ATCC 36951 TaxID=1080233 RepID=A0A6A6D622_ZASCE|nr:uncharacterized protein M409DRAFT_49604 [Zasmidium cellare ATCC 36951]KAF2173116.1 hypothetical protein M409DRAFT_49604 [Zasmidium cellare ATCC 36951]